MPMQTFSWHHLNQWHFGLIPLLMMFGAALAYGIGVRRTPGWSGWATTWFASGLVVTFLATQSVLGVYDMSLYADHMIQHLLLIMVAAPFFALARPLDLLYEVGGSHIRAFLDGRVMALVTHPIAGFALYFISIPVLHVTPLFAVMMHHMWAHHLEQLIFLFVGYLFFRVAFGAERGRHLHPGLRVVYVMAAVPADTFTGLTIINTTNLPFPDYLSTMTMGTTTNAALNMYHLGGAIMWIGGDALMLLACIPMVVQWVRWETKRTKEIDAELDRLGL